MPLDRFRLPDDSNRHVIVGKTGSGKTVAGSWALSKRSFNRIPWVILDYKRDQLFGQLYRAREVDFRRAPPTKPGLYITRPLPELDEDDVDKFLWSIWRQGETGVFIDEMYMLGQFNKPLRAILTQGRSKRIPVIMLTQRPSWISPFAFSESEFLQSFFLHNRNDVKRMGEWIPGYYPPRDYRSIYYDVSEDRVTHLAPVPSEDEIIERINARLAPNKRIL